MSNLETKALLLQMVEEGAVGLLPKYLERLHDTEEATLDDQRKAIDLMFKAMGIGAADKVDSRVVVDIHIENGLVTSATPITLESDPGTLPLLEDIATYTDPTQATTAALEAPKRPLPHESTDVDFSAELDAILVPVNV